MVVVGTGGVGLSAIQGAVVAGAGRDRRASTSRVAKRDAAVRFGATRAVDPEEGDPGGARSEP